MTASKERRRKWRPTAVKRKCLGYGREHWFWSTGEYTCAKCMLLRENLETRQIEARKRYWDRANGIASEHGFSA